MCSNIAKYVPLSGLPAFKPGEKVQLDFGMDDL